MFNFDYIQISKFNIEIWQLGIIYSLVLKYNLYGCTVVSKEYVFNTTSIYFKKLKKFWKHVVTHLYDCFHDLHIIIYYLIHVYAIYTNIISLRNFFAFVLKFLIHLWIKINRKQRKARSDKFHALGLYRWSGQITYLPKYDEN